MNNYCERAIRTLGVPISVTTPQGTAEGFGVIMPSRNKSRNNGGISVGCAGVSEPQRFSMISESGVASGMRYGDRVSDGENEYYVLWTDSVEGRFGRYAKTEMQLMREGRTDE